MPSSALSSCLVCSFLPSPISLLPLFSRISVLLLRKYCPLENTESSACLDQNLVIFIFVSFVTSQEPLARILLSFSNFLPCKPYEMIQLWDHKEALCQHGIQVPSQIGYRLLFFMPIFHYFFPYMLSSSRSSS